MQPSSYPSSDWINERHTHHLDPLSQLKLLLRVSFFFFIGYQAKFKASLSLLGSASKILLLLMSSQSSKKQTALSPVHSLFLPLVRFFVCIEGIWLIESCFAMNFYYFVFRLMLFRSSHIIQKDNFCKYLWRTFTLKSRIFNYMLQKDNHFLCQFQKFSEDFHSLLLA